MSEPSSARAVALCLCATLIVGAAEAQPNDQSWGLSVVAAPARAPSKGMPVGLLAGLKNNTRVARLVCIAGTSWTVRTPDLNETDAFGPSPHSCRDESSFVIVLPGETRFLPVLLDPRRVMVAPTSTLEVSVFVSEGTAVRESEEHVSLEVRWEGSLEEARKAGSGLGIDWERAPRQ
jgi:hypothetical protein